MRGYEKPRTKDHPNYPRKNNLEDAVYDQIKRVTGTEPRYEDTRVSYVAKPKTYTPDFILPNGIHIEVKGYFEPCDRSKHLLVKQQHPDLDIRFVFSNPNSRLSRSSSTTYAQWCTKHGFQCAKGTIPDEWFKADEESCSR